MVQICKSKRKCLGLQMARMEMDGNFIALCLGKLAKPKIIIDSLFENLLDTIVKIP